MFRAAAGFSNPGGLAVMWWVLSAPPLVVIGLTELPNSGWAPPHPLAAALMFRLDDLEFNNLCIL